MTSRLTVFHDDRIFDHDTGEGIFDAEVSPFLDVPERHPENAQRLRNMVSILKRGPLKDRIDWRGAAPATMDPRWFVPPGGKLPEKIEFPTPTMPREVQQEQFVRDLEIDPKKYYPPDAYRTPVQKWPGVTLNPREMLKARGIDPDDLG